MGGEFQLPELQNYIDGEFSTPANSRGQQLHDANSGEPLQVRAAASAEQVGAALAAAERVHQARLWEETSASERAEWLDRIATELEADGVADTISQADSLTSGAIIRTTRKMARLLPMVFRGAAAYLREGHLDQRLPGPCGDVEYLRRPWGPALLIAPWNGPTAIGSHKVASALAAGAPCILKPSEFTPHSAVMMARAIDRAGLPPGIFQLTVGDRSIARQMIEAPCIKAVSFTGGLAGGRAIARLCADDFVPTQLELGGNNQLVVFEDADLDKAATGIAYGLTNLNGQWCRALGRLLVHKSVKQALLERVLAILADIRLGHSLDEESDMGPLVHGDHYEQVLQDIERLRRCGGELLCSTALPQLPGYFVAPTLVDGCEPRDTREEIFGPVATVHSFSDDDEALALANGTELGLAGYVYSGNLERAFAFARRMRTGGVKINGYSLLSIGEGAPRSAWGLSGLGEEGHAQSIEFFTGARVIGVSPQDPLGGR
ncbi:aldehyde dehydrogenase family protein [Biformimicrobium ophioploci]|uniref:5-carboxymethyl-2-hydroxymuconate semialdehyde dehydrogenase n=1 Tax=Biformimicrobium ophioploci TaxID=3036711 RepID=A0ABQ6LW83_9GAMM|nr:aldehyde dehydrogenase family protein [Microbulbifer sp. NKW57]GMG86316.1 5-carboxymethyl-2-hydroxymuconate semialdehyde dehydrogenase [Microbulbifer sp. NKW57]